MSDKNLDVLAVLRDPHYDLRPFDDFEACAAAVTELVEAAKKAKRALLSGQPEVRGDDTVYPLEGALVGNALDALRTALAKFAKE